MFDKINWDNLTGRNQYNDLAYEFWKAQLPANLRKETTDYNLYGAYKGGLQPHLEDDGKYHLDSRNPNTGEILKRKSHPTYKQAIENEKRAGYYPYEKNGVTYTKAPSPLADISGYDEGSDGVGQENSKVLYDPTTGLFYTVDKISGICHYMAQFTTKA